MNYQMNWKLLFSFPLTLFRMGFCWYADRMGNDKKKLKLKFNDNKNKNKMIRNDKNWNMRYWGEWNDVVVSTHRERIPISDWRRSRRTSSGRLRVPGRRIPERSRRRPFRCAALRSRGWRFRCCTWTRRFRCRGSRTVL